ncbi:MAG: hypothetical protein COA75_04440 [Cellvibrionales bacterium]|nr:MAG: hypothetical protein COA75_04440 [Cellvibrionales bacterium]
MSADPTPIIGVLLAGGQSSRMGEDKANLAIANTTLLKFMHAKLQQAGFDEIVICRNAPGYLNDTVPQLGPLGALHTLGQHYPGRRALIIPVDMPLLSVASLKAFATAALSLNVRDSTLPATLGQQMFPLYLPFTPAVIEALHQRTRQGDDLSIAAFLRDTHGQTLSSVELHDDECLNANTPAQWQTILAKVSTTY